MFHEPFELRDPERNAPPLPPPDAHLPFVNGITVGSGNDSQFYFDFPPVIVSAGPIFPHLLLHPLTLLISVLGRPDVGLNDVRIGSGPTIRLPYCRQNNLSELSQACLRCGAGRLERRWERLFVTRYLLTPDN